MRPLGVLTFLGAVVAAALLLGMPAANLYYRSAGGEGCARCHEIRDNFDSWSHSSHRKIACVDCHASSMAGNLRRVVHHAKGDVPEQIRLGADDVFAMMDRCRGCHQQEFAQWAAGPHATTYAKILTDHEHNAKRPLRDDCLRCHGMHFEGGIQDAVEPVNSHGPWRLKDARYVNRPAIPCLACHAVHREGTPLRPARFRSGPKQELMRPSLGLFDRRSRMNVRASELPVPAMFDGERAVRMSPDRRQGLCYQCHAATAAGQIASGDDRTPVGVHEGLSCLACHQKHGQATRQSCAECHPRLSNCGLDVEKMDTTFLNPKSRHDVHRVKCLDCHPQGVPPKKRV